MTFRPNSARTWHALAAFALAAVWSGFLASAHLEGRATFLDRIEAPLLDLRFALAGPRPAPSEVMIVALDDATVAQAGTYPLPRATLARLIGTLAAASPRAIGLDVLFLEHGPEAGDQALAAALRQTGAVIAGAALFASGEVDDGVAEIPRATQVLWPIEALRTQTSLGLVNVSTDLGGTPRHVPLLIRSGDALLPSFPLQLAARAAGAEPVLAAGELGIGPTRLRPDLGLTLPLRFYGPRGTVPTLSAAAILGGRVAPDALRNRILLVGSTATAAGDSFATPFDSVLPGVEVLATALAHLVTGDGLVRDRHIRRVDASTAIGFAGAAALLLPLAPPSIGLAVLGLAVAAWLGLVQIAFMQQGLWLAAALPIAALAPVAAFGIAGRVILERRLAGRLARAEQALRVFHPPSLATRIARDAGFLAAPVTQPAGIVFVDLSGFTALSETLGPAATRSFLRDFHALVEQEITRAGGVVMAFMGDGAMSLFGLPEPAPEDADHALAAACSLIPRVRSWLATEARINAVDLRVGAHYGTVVVSRLGSDDHQHITATGDSVNVASRLMEVGKSLGAALVASEDLLAACRASQPEIAAFEGRRDVAIRGRNQPLGVAFRWTQPGRPERPG
ncbi:CHASE2 domain-containing protein [Methylobacterium nodulans]|uniref:Adenylate/guanylate cyclase with Chase sensor n=1 Tax=Methylobacterium nodulans (strain LMG 21967 / CNCM I-2342 / ORS 2060) TaxID=460265 RepID=B8ID72_METNO|nr:adenylate/guanylate cyclase domain-containing protein [Methylobacterium nodulans]ACL59464.1 adenylate/guanylate cyclase with Chase sensor [Methylobacterium nodulans ORS 2060]